MRTVASLRSGYLEPVAKQILLVVLPLVLLATSCSRPLRLKLCNNTTSEIVVHTSGQTHSIRRGETKVFEFPADTKHLAITSEGVKWEYEVGYPPQEYCHPTSAAVIHAQVEERGKIYVLLPDIAMPASDLPSQPDGFPLTPRGDKEL